MKNEVLPLTVGDLERGIGECASLLLLDVREPWEREWASIAVSGQVADLHVPMNRVPMMFKEIQRAASEAEGVVVYCHHGVRSRQVAEWLLEQGLERVANLEGGIDAWSIEVDPSVKRY